MPGKSKVFVKWCCSIPQSRSLDSYIIREHIPAVPPGYFLFAQVQIWPLDKNLRS